MHYETGKNWLRERWEFLMSAPLEPLSFLNVNVPAIAFDELRGERITAMGKRVYEDRVELRHDPWNRPYYWQGGVVVMDPDQPGTDVQAVSEGFVSITPITLDWTHYDLMERLKEALDRRLERAAK